MYFTCLQRRYKSKTIGLVSKTFSPYRFPHTAAVAIKCVRLHFASTATAAA